MAAVPTSRDFFDLVKAIGESKSKQEEDRIIADEVKYVNIHLVNVIEDNVFEFTTPKICWHIFFN